MLHILLSSSHTYSECALYHNLNEKYTVNTASSPLEHCTSSHHSPAPPACLGCLRLRGWGSACEDNPCKKTTRWWLIVARPARDTGTPLKANMCHSFYCVRAPPAISVHLSSVPPFFINDNCAAQHFLSPHFRRSLWGRVCPSVQTMWNITKVKELMLN